MIQSAKFFPRLFTAGAFHSVPVDDDRHFAADPAFTERRPFIEVGTFLH
jgi:hypothetical protein